jgi:hypothetical protein
MRMRVDDMVSALVLVRLGQELGSDSTLARAVHDLASLAIAFFRS